MHVHAGLLAQKAQVVGELRIVLPPADPRGDLLVESLYAHLKLQRARREARDRLTQRIGQAIGDHLKMQKQSRRVALEKELQDRPADVDVQTERAIDELELP